jgi:hypothetical protein
MGMFDYIEWQAPLPDGWSEDGDLQTKSFDCELARYRVTADGELLSQDGSAWFEEERPLTWVLLAGAVRWRCPLTLL